MNEELDMVLANMAESTNSTMYPVDLADRMGISVPRARHYLRELERQNLVWLDRESDGYGLTEDGDEYIVQNDLDKGE